MVRTHPHETGAFTQGLVWADGLYESTGHYGESTIRRVDLQTGRVLACRPLPADVFGEGLTAIGRTLVQLTWREHLAYVYDRDTLELQQVLPYPHEGWGLTDDGTSLIASDGSDVIRWLEPRSLAEIRQISVHHCGWPIDQLNDLQYVDGEIYANIWGDRVILRICAETGRVKGWLDFSAIASEMPPPRRANVLNGIAYDRERKRLLVTGKRWPLLFEIDLHVQRDASSYL